MTTTLDPDTAVGIDTEPNPAGQNPFDHATFGRSRFLRYVGGAVFGAVAMRMLAADPALAHGTTPPACCGPSGTCSCCNGTTCCSSKCSKRTGECNGELGGWYCCMSSGTLFFCADWWDSDGHKCICAGIAGQCV